MAVRGSSPTLYFEDYLPGSVFDCGSVTVREPEIIAFAEEYGPRPLRGDPPLNGGLVASHWHTASLVMRLIVDNFMSAETGLGSAGIDELRWPQPVKADDTLRVSVTVVEARRSRGKPDRGIVRALVEVVNQHGATVMGMTAINFVRTRTQQGDQRLDGNSMRPDPGVDEPGDRGL
jgi:acyl dehydratase